MRLLMARISSELTWASRAGAFEEIEHGAGVFDGRMEVPIRVARIFELSLSGSFNLR